MIFKKEKTYYTSLGFEEIIRRLNSVTVRMGTSSDPKIVFEGKIMETGFTILPTFNYSQNEQLRPEIKGELSKERNGTQVSLKFQLPSGLKGLFVFVLVLNIGLALLMIAAPDLTDFPGWDMWWVILVFLPITFFMFHVYFSYKVNKAIRILKSFLEMS